MVSARDVTDTDAVRRSIAECDRVGREKFRSRDGFAQSKRYVLRHDGKDYDPAPIVAVAYGEQHERGHVLTPVQARGAHRVLKALGFEIVDLTPPWTKDELVLALDVYLRHRGEPLGRGHTEVRALSDTLKRLAPLQHDARRAAARNMSRVAEEIGRFGSLDPRCKDYQGDEPSELQRTVWGRYAQRRRRLGRAVAAISNLFEGVPSRVKVPPRTMPSTPEPSLDRASLPAQEGRRPRTKPVVGEWRRPYVSRPRPKKPRQAKPSQADAAKHEHAKNEHWGLEQELVTHLRSAYFTIYECLDKEKRDDLQFDLNVEQGDLSLIIEIKSLPRGGKDYDQIRYGLGQVLWYQGRQFEGRPPGATEVRVVPVLYVEREPADAATWRLVCASVGVVLSWPDRLRSLVDECRAMAGSSAQRY